MERAKDQQVFIENPRIFRASELSILPLENMAALYSETWREAGIFVDVETAMKKISAVNPRNIFLLTDDKNNIYAELLTATVNAISIKYFADHFPTYETVEKNAKYSIPNPTYIVCFSLNCKSGYRVMTNGVDTSLARTVLTSIPVPEGARKLAYSFIPGVSPETSLENYYIANLSKSRNLGPVGMHEALGAMTVAFLKNSRHEHLVAGRGNVLVVYPIDENEEKFFKDIKEKRLLKPWSIATATIGNAVYL